MSTTFAVSQSSESVANQYASPKPAGDGSTTEKADVEVPFTEYRNVNKLPFTADYVDAKLTWDEQLMTDDIMEIEDYLIELVNTGELDNSTKAARAKLKDMEKMANIDKIESKAQKLIKLAEFVHYMKRLDERKHGTE